MAHEWEAYLTPEDKRVLESYGYDNCHGTAERPALLVIDMSYKFLGDRPEPIEQAVRLRRTACGDRGWRTIPAFRRLLDSTRAKGLPIIYTTGDERPPLAGFGARPLKSVKPVRETRNDLRDSYQIIDELAPLPTDIVVKKQKPSAFFGTPLINFLVALRVDSLFITGTATSGCVRATAVDAFSHGYPCSLVSDCCFDRFEASHVLSLFDLGAKYAEIIDSSEAVTRIGALPPDLFA